MSSGMSGREALVEKENMIIIMEKILEGLDKINH
jgi:hypothetical protein